MDKRGQQWPIEGEGILTIDNIKHKDATDHNCWFSK